MNTQTFIGVGIFKMIAVNKGFCYVLYLYKPVENFYEIFHIKYLFCTLCKCQLFSPLKLANSSELNVVRITDIFLSINSYASWREQFKP